MAEAAAEEGSAAHLPHQPGEGLGASGARFRQEFTEFFGEIQEDGPRFEYSNGLWSAAVEQGRDLGIGIDVDETTAELVAVADADRPGVIFRAAVTLGEQLLEHDADLLAVGRRERVELEGMLADGQLLLVSRAGNRAVDIDELPAAGLLPSPHLRENIFSHSRFLCVSSPRGS